MMIFSGIPLDKNDSKLSQAHIIKVMFPKRLATSFRLT
jgi:hypothetical protein